MYCSNTLPIACRPSVPTLRMLHLRTFKNLLALFEYDFVFTTMALRRKPPANNRIDPTYLIWLVLKT